MNTTQKELIQYANKHSWKNQMDTSQGVDGWNNYGGPNLGDVVVVIGRNRDSEILEESNFEAALGLLGGESKSVHVERFGHWGCGWFELILVDPRNKAKLKIAYDIHKKLEDYPILDDIDYNDREWEYRTDYAEGAKQSLAQALALHFGLPEKFASNKDLIALAYYLNIECQCYYGNDACIDVYTAREPDDTDIKRLKQCLSELSYNLKENPAYQYICAAVGMEGA